MLSWSKISTLTKSSNTRWKLKMAGIKSYSVTSSALGPITSAFRFTFMRITADWWLFGGVLVASLPDGSSGCFADRLLEAQAKKCYNFCFKVSICFIFSFRFQHIFVFRLSLFNNKLRPGCEWNLWVIYLLCLFLHVSLGGVIDLQFLLAVRFAWIEERRNTLSRG